MTACSNFVFELKAGSRSTELTLAFGHAINAWETSPGFFRSRAGVPAWTGKDLGLAGTAGLQGVLRLPQSGIDELPIQASGELDVFNITPTAAAVPPKGTWTLVRKH